MKKESTHELALKILVTALIALSLLLFILPVSAAISDLETASEESITTPISINSVPITDLADITITYNQSEVSLGATKMSICDLETAPEGSISTPIMINNVTDFGRADITISYNQSVVHVTAVDEGDLSISDKTINNIVGFAHISVTQETGEWLNGDIKLANLTLKAVGNLGEASTLNINIIELKTVTNVDIPAYVENGTFTILDQEPTPSPCELYYPSGSSDPQYSVVHEPSPQPGLKPAPPPSSSSSSPSPSPSPSPTPTPTPTISGSEDTESIATLDSDGDGYSDRRERSAGTDPLDSKSYPGAPVPKPASTVTPAVTPPVSESINEDFREISLAQILFNVPKTMVVGEKERIEVRITKNFTVNLTEGLKGCGDPHVEAIMVDTYMTVKLMGDSVNIIPLSNEEQVVRDETFTHWDWDITPLKSGTQTLHLLVTVRIKRTGFPDEKWDNPVLDRDIYVKPNYWYSFNNLIKHPPDQTSPSQGVPQWAVYILVMAAITTITTAFSKFLMTPLHQKKRRKG